MRRGVAACATSISDGTGFTMFSSFFPGKLILAVAFVVTELKLLLKTPETLRVDDDENDFGYDEIFAILNTACCALIRRRENKKALLCFLFLLLCLRAFAFLCVLCAYVYKPQEPRRKKSVD